MKIHFVNKARHLPTLFCFFLSLPLQWVCLCQISHLCLKQRKQMETCEKRSASSPAFHNKRTLKKRNKKHLDLGQSHKLHKDEQHRSSPKTKASCCPLVAGCSQNTVKYRQTPETDLWVYIPRIQYILASFCTVGGSGDMSSIFKYHLWLEPYHPSDWMNGYSYQDILMDNVSMVTPLVSVGVHKDQPPPTTRPRPLQTGDTGDRLSSTKSLW